jgi:hypothetical protein
VAFRLGVPAVREYRDHASGQLHGREQEGGEQHGGIRPPGHDREERDAAQGGDDGQGCHLEKLASRLGKPRALSVLAHKLGRAFYHMLRTKEVFDIDRFLRP